MGRIADAALAILEEGPAHARDLGAALKGQGITHARDPVAAVRRALRDDARVAELDDGRMVSVGQALRGVTLTVVVTGEAARAGGMAVDLEPDLAPLAIAGVGPVLPLPSWTRAGQTLAISIEGYPPARVAIQQLDAVRPVPADERALVAAARERLSAAAAEPWTLPPITHVSTVALAVAASSPARLRRPGRPLGDVLRDAGLELHMAWIGPRGTAWQGLTELEADALADEVADMLAAEAYEAAIAAQRRLVVLLERHLPDRAAAATRRLAALLARGGHHEEGSAILAGLFAADDPEDRYEGALIAMSRGDLRLARRLVQEGLARASAPSEVLTCLEDLASDLDSRAAYRRLRDAVVHAEGEEIAERAARAIIGPGRAGVAESMIEQLFADLTDAGALALMEDMAAAGPHGREACLACSRVLRPPLSTMASLLAEDATAAHPAVAGLMRGQPVEAWATSPLDAPDQQQLVIAIARENGRVAPFVAVIDYADMNGAVKDAAFLPDMAEPRLQREILRRMDDLGIPAMPIAVEDAVEALLHGLSVSHALGWRLPSQDDQPVLDRIDRWIVGSLDPS